MNEKWHKVEDFPNYEVSSIGCVRRVGVIRGKAGANIIPYKDGMGGYLKVCLRKNGKTYKKFVHRLVCAAFHGEPRNGLCIVDHKDGDKTNNFEDNLRWADQCKNLANSRRSSGKKYRGISERNGKFKAYGSDNSRTVYLGTFDTAAEAAKAYDAYAKTRYGEFSILNFPNGTDQTTGAAA